jgi:hypothetical protein
MKGWKTIIVGLLVAIAPAALTYLASVDWTQYVPPNVAVAIAGVMMVLMRMVTTTPPGQNTP